MTPTEVRKGARVGWYGRSGGWETGLVEQVHPCGVVELWLDERGAREWWSIELLQLIPSEVSGGA